MNKPRLLDLFSGAGGCTKGYQRAGFHVVGVDIDAQPRYCGDAFVQGDAIAVMSTLLSSGYIVDRSGKQWRLSDFVAISASPPCQGYGNTHKITGKQYPLLIEPVRALLYTTFMPYVIENVPGAPLINPVTLLGTMFNLITVRPRLFECNFFVDTPPVLAVNVKQAKMGRKPKEGEYIQVVGNYSGAALARRAMDIDWMNREELKEAIPPVYTEHVGKFLMKEISRG